MIIMCPAIGDQHAAGPHRIVIPVTTITRRVKGNPKARITTTDIGDPLTVCATCDHWVKRLVYGCFCSCHRSD